MFVDFMTCRLTFDEFLSTLYITSVFDTLILYGRYETVTQNDVDHARHHDHNEAAEAAEAESSEAVEADGSILKLNLIGEKPTKRPHNPEEHTNVIPHIPNYWTPSDTSSIIMYSSKYVFHTMEPVFR